MNKKQIMDVALIPTVVLFVLQLISFVTVLVPRLNLYASSDSSVLPLLGIILYLLPAIIYLYTGYSAVKNYKLGLGEAISIGVIMSALMTLSSTLITAEMTMYQTRIESSYYIYVALTSMIFGLVGGSLFNGFLAFVGGLVAQPKSETAQAEKKPVDWMVVGALAIVVVLVIVFVLFYLGFPGSGPGPNTISHQCEFPAGITCISNKLNTSGGLTLNIGQGTGHPIMVTGVNCTMNSSATWASDNKATLVYSPNTLNVPVNITSGDRATVAQILSAGGMGSVTCRNADGSAISGVAVGSAFNGKIYVRYTEMDTNITRTIMGTYTVRYEV